MTELRCGTCGAPFPELEPEKWIKCSDRLPSKDDIILVIHEINPMPVDYEYNIDVCRFDGEVFVHPSGLTSTHDIEQCDADDGEDPITHWMPLPSPPDEVTHG